MNILIDGLPDTVMVGDKEYPINYGFRTSMLYELLIQDDSLTDNEKIIESLRLYYSVLPDDLTEAVKAIVWFYSCGKPKEDKKHKEEHQSEDKEDEEDEDEDILQVSDMVYSFEHDAPYIYAAFLEQYGIDLTSIADEDLHWWKFKAMFSSLSEKTKFMEIIGYRSVKITDKMTNDQKAFYRRMKKVYALPMSQTEIEKQNAIIEALERGEDVSSLL